MSLLQVLLEVRTCITWSISDALKYSNEVFWSILQVLLRSIGKSTWSNTSSALRNTSSITWSKHWLTSSITSSKHMYTWSITWSKLLGTWSITSSIPTILEVLLRSTSKYTWSITLKYSQLYLKCYFEVTRNIFEVFEPSRPLGEPGGFLGPKYFEVFKSILEVLLWSISKYI